MLLINKLKGMIYEKNERNLETKELRLMYHLGKADLMKIHSIIVAHQQKEK